MALLEAKNLGISFGGLRAVDDFNIKIEKGSLYGLIGPNGAGKTTVFNLLTGVYKPTEGIITLDGKDVTGKKTIEINQAGIDFDGLFTGKKTKNLPEYSTVQGSVCDRQCKSRSA